MSKRILRIEQNYDFTLIGISTSCRDYRLCWFINNQLGLEFVRIKDLESWNDNAEMFSLSLFKYSIENTEIDLYLLNNKSNGGILIPESKESDFFILSTEKLSFDDERELISNLNKIEVVQTAYSINIDGLKSKDNLLFF